MNNLKLEHGLSPAFPKMRRITETGSNIIVLIVLGAFYWLYHYFSWPTWALWIIVGLVVVTIVSAIWSLIEPDYLYRSWSYQYDEVYLQMRYGVFRKQWVTVPMTKIQTVSTVQGPIMKKFNTRSIKVETMGSSHTIPALPADVALALREDIAEYAKLKEVDE